MKKAIVLGGTHDHITLLEKLKELGYYTILIDYFENPPAAKSADEHIKESALDEDLVLKIAKDNKVDLVLATCIDQPLLTVASVSEKLNLPCHISYETAFALTNKTKMKLRFTEYEIPTSNFEILKPGDKIQKDLKYPLVVKPADANSSKGVQKVWDSSNLDAALIEAFDVSRTKTAIVEEFKVGDELSVDVLIRDGIAEILMISENIKSKIDENRFTITESFYSKQVEDIIKEKVQIVAQKIADAYGLKNCPILIQLINNNGDLSVIEFSARIGGGSKHHFIKTVTGFDILEFFVSSVIGKDLEVRQQIAKPNYGLIKYIYCSNGVLAKMSGFEELKGNIISEYFFYKTIGMEIYNHISSSDRPAGILILADTESELENKLNKSFMNIQILNEAGLNLVLKN